MYETKQEVGNAENRVGTPEKKFKAGAISATVWQNSGKNSRGESVAYRTISFQRSYRDRNGAWQISSSLRVNDLPKASVVLQKAYEYVVLSGMQEHNNEAYITEEVI